MTQTKSTKQDERPFGTNASKRLAAQLAKPCAFGFQHDETPSAPTQKSATGQKESTPRPWQRYMALRMVCQGDIVNRQMSDQLSALLSERDELSGALKEINEEIPARPKLPLVSKIADIARSALAASQARSILAGAKGRQ